MSLINLFSTDKSVKELRPVSVSFEKELQNLVEANMETFFGVTFIKSEYRTTDGGRMDSIGMDENGCPIIFEYKRNSNENIINQGLFYLNWLLDHKGDFHLLVMQNLGKTKADNIDWTNPGVICIALDFTKYDEHAVIQIKKNIKLVKYKKYNNGFILFEHIHTPNMNIPEIKTPKNEKKTIKDPDHNDKLQKSPPNIQNLYASIKNYILSFGDDVTENILKHYIAFKKVKNIGTVVLWATKIDLCLALSPSAVNLEEGFTRDMTNIGHNGKGNLCIIIKDFADFEKAKPFIDKAYNEN